MNSLLSSNIKIVLLLTVLSVSHTFSQVNEDFSWVKKEQIKTVQITSSEESDRKEVEEIFEYNLNGSLVRYELTEGWFKYIKEFNHQGFIELEAELVRFDSELFFDTANVTYYEYDGERIKKEISREFVVMKGDTTEELSEPEGAVEDEWETRVPTTLAIVQDKSAQLDEDGLPCCNEVENEDTTTNINESNTILGNIIPTDPETP